MNVVMDLRRLALAAAVVAGIALLMASCGGDDAKKTATPTAASTPAGPPLSDEAYLKVFCKGLVDYQDALLTARTADAITKVIQQFADAMEKVAPPSDIQRFHTDFVAYLRASVKEPTSLLTKSPPMPGNKERDRLASRVSSVPECKYPTFLGEKRP